jgi:hypothetical protein
MASRHGRGRSLARSATKKVPTIAVKVDPVRATRWKKLRAVLESERRKEAGGFDTYWEAVGEILDAELYVAGGFETADDFLREVVKEPRRTAIRNIRVARYASPEQEVRYGTAILDAAIGYVEAKLGAPAKGKLPIHFDELRVGAKKLADATLKDIQAATKALLGKKGKSKAKPPSPSEQAIVKALARVKPLSEVKVHVSGGMLHLSAIPLHAVGDLIKALRGLDLPVGG